MSKVSVGFFEDGVGFVEVLLLYLFFLVIDFGGNSWCNFTVDVFRVLVLRVVLWLVFYGT